MKTLYLYLLAAFLFAGTGYLAAQQDSSGIYKTASDYEEGRMSFAVDCKNSGEKITIEFNRFSRYVGVKHSSAAGKKILDVPGDHYFGLDKREVFGYRTCDGSMYRLIGNKVYQVMNPKETILIYILKRPARSSRDAGKTGNRYYFGVGTIAPVQKLTRTNLKAAFPDNLVFQRRLNEQFKHDKELNGYDDVLKIYKVNLLLQKQ